MCLNGQPTKVHGSPHQRDRRMNVKMSDTPAQLPNNERQGAPRNRWRPLIWGFAGSLLLLPLIAMQFTNEVNWTGLDFLVMGAMLTVACGCYEIATRMSGNLWYRIGAGIGIIGSFLLVWINLAVGIIGAESNPANLMYFAVLMFGVIGSLSARFKPQGMFKTTLTMAIAMLLIGVIAIFLDLDGYPVGLMRQVLLNGFFAGVYAMSAGLFRLSATNG